MSSNIEIAGTFWESVRSGDLERALAVLHPEVVLREAEGLPFGGIYHGRDGIRSLAEKTFAVFDQSSFTYDLLDAGETVIARLHQVWIAHATGQRFDNFVLDVYAFRDGMIVEMDVYYKDTKAVADLWAELGQAPDPA